jgi:alpha-mannosidase
VSSGFRDYYPERDIDEAWKIVLRNQFHDILDGSSIGPVYEESGRYYREAASRAQRALDFSLKTILSVADTRGAGVPLAIFNPLFWERTEPATVEVIVPGSSPSLKILNPQAEEIPVQILERDSGENETRFRLIFLAEKVPSFGYRIYRAIASEKPTETAGPALRVSPRALENEFFRVELDERTGWIKSLYDKRAKREVLSGPGNMLQSILDEPESMSAWELGLKDEPVNLGTSGAATQVIESGPIRGVIRITTPLGNSVFEQDLTLWAGVARVDCRMRLNWQERNLMIKAAFPLNLKSGQAEFEIPYGSVTRPADGTEVPALRWVDVSDPISGTGLSLLSGSKYGFDVKGTTLRMSIVHGATSPDPEADRGWQELNYSLYPHTGTWREADTIRRGYEIANDLIVRTGMSHKGSLPAARSFVEASPSNIVLSGFKLESGYNSRNIIIRLYEAFGRKTEARVLFPWPVQAEETDLIERPVKGTSLSVSSGEGNGIVVPMKPYEIKTLRVTRR